ncbi:Hypothetical protein DHA2_154493 [Giardia duodenalis]|uniref:Uncharacterized protein n=1 Tax=Giardia intestinalis TaxID=5741 RepID=V6TK15_GIAIN|nr:Hypothetical protein DHA2_154493 [Giardia intestinalis]
MEDECVVGMGSEWSISPSASDEQALSPAAQKHAQPRATESRCAARRSRRKTSTQLLGTGHTRLAEAVCCWGSRYVERDRCAHQSASPCMPCGHHPCAFRWSASARSLERPVSGSSGGSAVSVKRSHDRPLIVLVLPHHWEEGRTGVLPLSRTG